MAEPSLLYTKAGGIARLTFNRPEVRNAIDPEALCRLADACQDIGADRDVRVRLSAELLQATESPCSEAGEP